MARVTSVADGGSHPTGLPYVVVTNGGGTMESVKATFLSQHLGVNVRGSARLSILSSTCRSDLNM